MSVTNKPKTNVKHGKSDVEASKAIWWRKKMYFERFKFELPCMHIIMTYPTDLIASFFIFHRRMTSQEEKHPLPSNNFAHTQRKYNTMCPAFHLSSTAKYFRRRVQGKDSISSKESNRMFISRGQPLTGIVRSGGRWAYCIARATAATSNLKKKKNYGNRYDSPSSETQGRSVGPGEKARRNILSTGGKAPGYRLSIIIIIIII